MQLIAKDSSGKIVSSQTSKPTKASLGNWQELEIIYQSKTNETVEVSVVNSSARVSALFDDLVLTTEPMLIVQENHYDPWGLNLVGIETQGQPDHKFQYNGKEKQSELGLDWSDYGARMYDAQLGRWFAVDPLSEKYFDLSPYNYADNNPVLYVDYDGRDFGINVQRNKKGEITGLQIYATVFIKGDGASKERSAQLTKYAGQYLKSNKVDGVNVSFNVQYTYEPDKEQEDLKASENLLVFKAGENPNKDFEGVVNGNKVSSYDELKNETTTVTYTGNTGTVFHSGKTNGVILHETGHLLGLADGYEKYYNNLAGKDVIEDMQGYEGDLMGYTGPYSGKPDFKDFHHKAYVRFHNAHKQLGDNYTSRISVDNPTIRKKGRRTK